MFDGLWWQYRQAVIKGLDDDGDFVFCGCSTSCSSSRFVRRRYGGEWTLLISGPGTGGGVKGVQLTTREKQKSNWKRWRRNSKTTSQVTAWHSCDSRTSITIVSVRVWVCMSLSACVVWRVWWSAKSLSEEKDRKKKVKGQWCYARHGMYKGRRPCFAACERSFWSQNSEQILRVLFSCL